MQYSQEYAIEAAIKAAIKQCIEENKWKEFLKTHGTEVVNMLSTEFNLEDAKKVWREERSMEIAISLLGLLDEETISEKTDLPIEEIRRLKDRI